MESAGVKDFGATDFLLAVIAKQDFMGSSGAREPAGADTMLRGISDRAQHRNRLGSTGCAVGRVPGRALPGYRAPAAP